jgi:hypothetical protein
MSEVAQMALRRLLASAESAHARGGATRKVTLAMTASSFPAYLQLARAEDKQAANMQFLAAERAGAVEVEWDSRAGERAHAVRLVLRDENALAAHLRVQPRWEEVDHAREQLQHLAAAYPVLEEVLERWSKGQKVRGTTTIDAADWADAARVVSFCRESSGQDVPVRRASAHLFRNSKRIQDIWRLVEVLSTNELQPSQNDFEEVLAGVGLVRFPPTFLLACDGHVRGTSGSVRVLGPYLGLPPAQVLELALSSEPQVLLTVENLTTFHELAVIRPAGGVLLYTGGMPARSWTAAYVRVLRSVPASCRCMHWGDIDAGGFRIAAHLARTCAAVDRQLSLHSMVWRPIGESNGRSTFPSSDLRQIADICGRWGWEIEGRAIIGEAYPIEQEELPAVWPTESAQMLSRLGRKDGAAA